MDLFNNQGQCSGCAAPILWAKSVNGKAMPVDVDPSEKGNLLLTENESGELMAVHHTRAAEFGADPKGERHTAHHATCPQAHRFR